MTANFTSDSDQSIFIIDEEQVPMDGLHDKCPSAALKNAYVSMCHFEFVLDDDISS